METRHNPVAAAGYMLLSAGFAAAVTLLAKLAGRDLLGEALHPLQVSHGRFLFAFLTIGITALILRPRIERVNLRLHTARSAAGWAGISLLFAAVAFIPLADATAISFLNPVFAMILAVPLLGERVGPWRWAAAGIALIGALVLLRPGSGTFQPAALLALASAVVIGFEVTLIKRLSGRERPLQILLINNMIGLCIATVAVVFVWTPPTAMQWLTLAGIGVLMAGAQATFLQAVKRADASFVVPFNYATLVYAGLLDFTVFGVIPVGSSLLGAAIIISGAALLVSRESRARRISG